MSKETKISIGIMLIGIVIIVIYWFIPQDKSMVQSTNASIEIPEKIILPQYENSIYKEVPIVQEYIRELKSLIANGQGILPLQNNELDGKAKKVQSLLLRDQDFIFDTKRGEKILHNDMMRIIPVISSVIPSSIKEECDKTSCYMAEKYNFVTNTTTRAIIDADGLKVLSVERYPDMQPDISLRLKRIAQAIALNAPEVAKELGKRPHKKDITMANVRGSMKSSTCENGKHLCVAPTFADHKNERALWVVVDLTQMRLAAAKWAALGKTATPSCISERSLQNRYIMENYCQKDSFLEKNGWQITYRLTGSDGLEVRNVSFKGQKVFKSAKIVDWHVSYKQEGADKIDMNQETYIAGRRVEFVRGEGNEYLFGYNDAMGCPLFSTSVVLVFNGPQIRKLKNAGGFMLTQDFRNPKWPMACNYRYENRFEFYDDGSFRIVGVSKGRGCGDNALYRPVMRIDMDIDTKENFYSYDGAWKLWEKEGSESVAGSSEQFSYKIVAASDNQKGYYLEPNRGQFFDNSRGDNATLYVTKFKENEGDQDLLTLGSCCDLKVDGMETYLNSENIKEENIVIWYVPRIRNDATKGSEYCWADTIIGADGNLEVKVWPCAVGPKFIPIVTQAKK